MAIQRSKKRRKMRSCTGRYEASARRVKRTLRPLRYSTCTLPDRKTLSGQRILCSIAAPVVWHDDLLARRDETRLGMRRPARVRSRCAATTHALRILRLYSVDAAITMKMWKTETAERSNCHPFL